MHIMHMTDTTGKHPFNSRTNNCQGTNTHTHTHSVNVFDARCFDYSSIFSCFFDSLSRRTLKQYLLCLQSDIFTVRFSSQTVVNIFFSVVGSSTFYEGFTHVSRVRHTPWTTLRMRHNSSIVLSSWVEYRFRSFVFSISVSRVFCVVAVGHVRSLVSSSAPASTCATGSASALSSLPASNCACQLHKHAAKQTNRAA